jgi:hypothetical protein
MMKKDPDRLWCTVIERGSIMRQRLIFVILLGVIFTTTKVNSASAVDIGVFYYPGWRSDYINWKDIKGLPGSRSPGKPWPERQPLLGYYPEEESWVADKHIDWASQYGITFFAYDWYWNGVNPEYDHALKNYLKSSNKSKLKFSLLWAYHVAQLKSKKEFDDMVLYWINNYFSQPTYYRIDDKPALFIFSYDQLENNAKAFGESTNTLLTSANKLAIQKGFKGIYFIITTNARPSDDIEKLFLDNGFNAYSGWNYVETKGARVEDYDVMVNGYLDYYNAAGQTAKRLPYIVPSSPGWDARPWSGDSGPIRTNPTPEKFVRMLRGAKQLMDSNTRIPKILMIEAWNEFGEGSYIEPTKQWGFGYLEAIKGIFAAPPAKTITK